MRRYPAPFDRPRYCVDLIVLVGDDGPVFQARVSSSRGHQLTERTTLLSVMTQARLIVERFEAMRPSGAP